MRQLTLILAVTLMFTGCKARDHENNGTGNHSGNHRGTPTPPGSFEKPETEKVVLVAIELNDDMKQQMATNGDGYRFVLRLIDKCFRGSIGSDDRLVIAQLSGNGSRSLLWEGKPLDLVRKHTPETFKELLLSKADPSGSQVFKGLQNALRYVHSDARVANGQAKVAVFVLSGMVDKTPGSREDELQFNYELSVLGRQGACMGMYYVDQQQLLNMQQKMQAFGITNNVVVGAHTGGELTFPNFD